MRLNTAPDACSLDCYLCCCPVFLSGQFLLSAGWFLASSSPLPSTGLVAPTSWPHLLHDTCSESKIQAYHGAWFPFQVFGADPGLASSSASPPVSPHGEPPAQAADSQNLSSLGHLSCSNVTFQQIPGLAPPQPAELSPTSHSHGVSCTAPCIAICQSSNLHVL